MIANSVTISRVLFSLVMFFLSPSCSLFGVLYLMCGVSDVLDGFLARKLHTESETGAMLDTIADLFFAAVYAVRILPLLRIPSWIWIWIALIAAVKIYGILKRRRKEQGLSIPHSLANKLSGLLIFLLPLSVRLIDISCGAVIVCMVTTFAAAEELFEFMRMKG